MSSSVDISISWCQYVIRESLRVTIDYLNVEEKVVVATSKVESVEVECSQLKKDLIAVMNERNDVNQKIKELTEALRIEKALVIQKDEEIQWTMKHHSLVVDFSGLDFEKIDTKILEDKAKEIEEIESSAMEKGPAVNKAADGKEVDESIAPPS
nr:hypothetical protein CFP56_69115 [Quercus suber]